MTRPENTALFMGIDVGSVTLKIAVLDEAGALVFDRYDRHHSRPVMTLIDFLSELPDDLKSRRFVMVVTGSGRKMLGSLLGVAAINEIVAHTIACHHEIPDVRAIIEIGGQDSKFVRLSSRTDGPGFIIENQQMNDICAAGTGGFIDQQAARLGMSLEAFGNAATTASSPAFVAGRCAVFSKTDITHLLQQGANKADIAAGICDAVARNYAAQFIKGKPLAPKVVFQGGLAGNAGVVAAFRRLFGFDEASLVVPAHHRIMGAIGTARYALSKGDVLSARFVAPVIQTLLAAAKRRLEKSTELCLFPKLARPVPPEAPPRHASAVGPEGTFFLGIDMGSTSTCLALVDEDGSVVDTQYTLNQGNVIDSVRHALSRWLRGENPSSNRAAIRAVGVTGSGRQAVANLFDTNIVVDEISAQARAAYSLCPDVDTVFEIGGQDAKYIAMDKGRVIDFEMNKVCAAGTGSFLSEQAARLGIPLEGLADTAFLSDAPVDLGSRCTVFMESDVVNYQQRGIPVADIVAGLSYSVARNYLEKVVGNKKVGKKILLLGGVALNQSVVSALNVLTKNPVVTSRHSATSAALGMALTARDRGSKGEGERVSLVDVVAKIDAYTSSSFVCTDCTHNCRINRLTCYNHQFHYGGACGKYEKRQSAGRDRQESLFRQRETLLRSFFDPSKPAPHRKMGVIRASLYYRFFPLYVTFLQELGYEVIVSDRSAGDIVTDGLSKTEIENCFASKIVYGHVENLKKKGVQEIFFPSVVEFERETKALERNYYCPHLQGIPFLLRNAFPEVRFHCPVFYREKRDRDWVKSLLEFGIGMGIDAGVVKRAVRAATEAQQKFVDGAEALGRKRLERLKANERLFVLIGKSYNVCDPSLNLRVEEKFATLGEALIPYNVLPLSEVTLPSNYRDLVWNAGQSAAKAAKVILSYDNVYPVFLTNFGCGPDSFILKYIRELFSDRSLLVLEVDEHSADVGMTTRIEAFLNNLRRSSKEESFESVSRAFKPFVSSRGLRHLDKTLYVPVGFDSYKPIAAAFASIGIDTRLLPEHDAETERLGRKYSMGNECLPYIMHVGDMVRMTRLDGFDPNNAALFLPASDLACRVSSFPTSMNLLFKELGVPEIPIVAPRMSINKDEALNAFGIKFAKNVVRGIVSVELLFRLLTRTRPYERVKGESDAVYQSGVDALCDAMKGGDFFATLDSVLKRFDAVSLDTAFERPVIGLVGDDYTRGNAFANRDIIREIESLGGEVRTVPIWASFLEFQMEMKTRRSLRKKNYTEFLVDWAKRSIGRRDITRIYEMFQGRLPHFPDPGFEEILDVGKARFDEQNEALCTIAYSHALNLLRGGVHGMVNLVGFQCMIHSIVTSHIKTLLKDNGDIPLLTLLFDFQQQGNLCNRLEAFMYQVTQCQAAYRHQSA